MTTTDDLPVREIVTAEGGRDFDTHRWSAFCLDNDFSVGGPPFAFTGQIHSVIFEPGVTSAS